MKRVVNNEQHYQLIKSVNTLIVKVGIYAPLNLIKALSSHNLSLSWSFMHVFTCLTGRLVTYTLNYQTPKCTCTQLGGERQDILYEVPICIP